LKIWASADASKTKCKEKNPSQGFLQSTKNRFFAENLAIA